MYALTVKQPWATLIVMGAKNVENRTWNPPRHVLGQRILIHAGKGWDSRGVARARTLGIELPAEIPRGAFVGSVVIADVTEKSDSPWFAGPKGWMLTGAVQFENIKPAKGKLGLWKA